MARRIRQATPTVMAMMACFERTDFSEGLLEWVSNGPSNCWRKKTLRGLGDMLEMEARRL